MLLFLRLNVVWRGPMPREVRRQLPRIKKAAFRIAGTFWHRRFRPKHFTAAGAREYRYDPRQGERGSTGTKRFRRSYTGQKLRRFGHTNPLVFTGESRALTAIRDVRATSKGVRVVMRAPRLNFRRRGSKKTMREEMTTISSAEARKLTDLIQLTMDRRIGAIRTVRTIRA